VHWGKPLGLNAAGHDDIANIGFIVGTRCVAVIDSGGSVRIGRALRAAVLLRTAVPICDVVNTHVHVDHVLGNLAFKPDRPSFIGHAALGAALARSRNFFVENYPGDLQAPPSAEQIIGPDRGVAVNADLELDLGERHLRLHAWPKAHTDCDLTVYDEKTGTLFAGDLLFVDRLPALDGSVKGWIGVIDELTHTSAKRVVPGHGPLPTDPGIALAAERRYLQTLLTGVRSEIAEGKPMDAAIAHVGATEKSRWVLWDETHPHNVARVYQELEWE
jgi:quinoprotein relay system zinc metallohydrolase 2